MLWKRLFSTIARDGQGTPPELERLASWSQFRAILRRERSRADRNNERFSLLVFRWKAGAATGDVLRLVRSLASRLRVADEIGWAGRDRVAVLLPGTSPEGAWRVATDTATDFPGQELPWTVHVHAYPADWVDGDFLSEHAAAPQLPNGSHAQTVESLLIRPMPLWKRCVDVVASSLGLLMLLPLFAVVALITRLTSPGPVFFLQRRAGLGGRPFWMYKFRSMVVGAEARQGDLMSQNEQMGPVFKIRHDPRVTRWGRLLRVTSIDELPQLWNVLRGDMSLVGPRPLPCHESAACRGWQSERLEVTPGLTCLWQVSGRSNVTFTEWMRMDIRYIRSRSWLGDLRLLFRTVPAVLLRTGAA